MDRWLRDCAKPRVRVSTYISYEGIIRLHIKPKIGGIALTKLSSGHVQAMLAAMGTAGDSARVQQLTYAVLNQAMKRAVRQSNLPRNVCEAVDPPRVPKKEIGHLNPEQAQAFLAAASGHRLEALFVAAIGTGLRQGELFGLQWADVDLAAGVLNVRRRVSYGKGDAIIVNEPKTAKGRRQVDLPGFVVEALHDHRRRMMVEGLAGCEWVFCDTVGHVLRRSNMIRGALKPLLKAAGLKAIRFHDLRHTCASLLFSQGVHPKIVQERLGHSTIGITLDVYSHVLPTMQREASGKLDSLLSKPAKVAAA